MIFDNNIIDFTKEPLFFGKGRNIVRLDLAIEQWILKTTDRALGLTWFKHDFSYTQDAVDYYTMESELQELFVKNLKFQTLLDSVAERSVSEVFKPITTNPQLESWWAVHAFQEDIHTQSYAEIIKALPLNSTNEFDDIMVNENILKRGRLLTDMFNEIYEYNAKRVLVGHVEYNEEYHKMLLVKALYTLNILEGGMFQSSFVTTYAFSENGMMESSAKTIGKIHMDESNHLAMTVYLLNRLRKDSEYIQIFKDLEPWVYKAYSLARELDYMWVDYLFPKDKIINLLGLNDKILKKYIDYNMYKLMGSLGLNPLTDKINNPCTWVSKYVNTSNLQVALNESDGVNYLLGKLNKDIPKDFKERLKYGR